MDRAEAGSLLLGLLAGPPGQDGTYFIDREGQNFHYVLNFLRDGPERFGLPASEEVRQELLHEARNLGLTAMVTALEKTGNESGTCNPDAYVGAPVPSNEVERMERLRGLEILGTDSQEHSYDCITRAIAALLDVPIALLSLVADDHQWFKSKCGLDADSTPRNQSFCAYMLSPEMPKAAAMFVIEDALRDPRVVNNPLVTGEPHIRFYAGAPLITSDGTRLGALCIIDRVPRALNQQQAQLLVNFAQIAVQSIECKQLLNKVPEDLALLDDDASVDFAAGPLRAVRMRDALSEAVLVVWGRADTMDWPIVYGNDAWTRLSGIRVTPPARFPGHARVEDIDMMGNQDQQRSLWDHLQLSSLEPESIANLWQMVKGDLGSQPAGRTLSVMASVAARRRLGAERLSVSCRLAPAEVPLDAGAAAIRPVAQYSNAQDGGIRPAGWPPGRLLFVTLVASKECERERPEKVSPVTSLTTTGTPSRAPTPSAQSLPSTATSSGVPRINGANVTDPGAKQKARRGPGLASMKPPRPPFEDVRLLRMVGQGSFGSVYFGLWSGASVAVKVIKSATKDGSEGKIKHDFEAALSASISHPNLVQTYKHGARMGSGDEEVDDKEPQFFETWIVQEWCDGGTLKDFCSEPRLEGSALMEVIEIGMEIARAGAYLHDCGIIHGDLTCNNVLLKTMPTRKGYVCKVCDFGLARILEGESQEIITQTLGTVTHMPPELFSVQSDKCKLTKKADVYAVGMILYQVVTAQVPFAGMSAPQIVVHVSRGKRLNLPAEVPEALANVYVHCLATEPEDRPKMEEVVTDLSKFYQDSWNQDVFDAPLEDAGVDTYRNSRSAPY